jgi:phage terminase Nu1 subunit (DNA packaging protein)
MTTAERFRLTLRMIAEEIPYLLRGTPEQVDRRFELLRLQNDDRNRRMLVGIARTREKQ